MKTSLSIFLISLISIGLLTSFINKDYTEEASDKFIVVLDAGHGGKDPGRPTKNGYKEKDIALKIALETGRQLEKIPGIKVVYTRKTDVFVDLFQRGKIANKAKANLFVSIHCNAHNTQAHGTETYVLATRGNKKNLAVSKAENEVIYLEEDYKTKYNNFDPNSPEFDIVSLLMLEEYKEQSLAFADLVQKNFTNDLKRKSRGVKDAGFVVLHQTIMPSVLIEAGFITHNKEGAYLNSRKGQKDISTSIAKAVLSYKKNLNVTEIKDVIEKNPEVTATILKNNSNVVFKVQIASSGIKLETKPYNFKNLSQVSRVKIGNIYKYFYGSTSSYVEAKQLKAKAKSKGYSSCFIVAYKNGNKISVKEALKTERN